MNKEIMKNIEIIKKEELNGQDISKFYFKFYNWYSNNDYNIDCIMYEKDNSVILYIAENKIILDFADEYHYDDFYDNTSFEVDIYNPCVLDISYALDYKKIEEILSSLSKLTGVKYPVNLNKTYKLID